MQSFDYDKDQVERVLSTFRDPWGSVCLEREAMFKRCACVDDTGRRRVCVPPATGYMCKRPALLLKMEVCVGVLVACAKQVSSVSRLWRAHPSWHINPWCLHR